MYRVIIDYPGTRPLGDHWYGTGDRVALPSIPGREGTFFNVVSLDPVRLPIPLSASVPRLYLLHRFQSDYGIEDLYFSIHPDKVQLLGTWTGGIPVYPDRMDHRPRAVSFEPLPPTQDPASPLFDPDSIQHPHHQLGGTPLLIQLEHRPLDCLSCGREMLFLLQFHSDRRLVTFEDSGCAYYWWCARCAVVGCQTSSL